MKVKIQTKYGQEEIDIYDSKTKLWKLQNGVVVAADSSTPAFAVRINGANYYAQTANSELASIIEKKGSGTVMPFVIGNELMYVARTAGSANNLFKKDVDTELLRITSDTTQTIPVSAFNGRGGVILICSGKGANVSGSVGGNGYIQRVEIPTNLKYPIQITTQFSQNSNSNGTSGGNAVRQNAYCYYDRPYWKCGQNYVGDNGSSGGVGGKNISVEIVVDGKTVTRTSFGGGGGGGLGGSVTTYNNCYNQSQTYSSSGECEQWGRYDYGTVSGSGGQGGLTGAGTGTRRGPSGRTGGNGLSYNVNDLNSEYEDWVSDACVIVYRYL